MKKIALLTSGGDSPGMNAAIRAVVRKSIYHGVEPVGIRRGYTGLIADDMFPMNLGSVADIIQRGGTILRTARSQEFMTVEGRQRAVANLRQREIDGLVVIGGDGSFRGAIDLHRMGVKVVGVPASIDNDIPGTDYAIGFDTAVNTVLDAINKIRDTATSHERIFLIEVMGHRTGFIAINAGLAGGAETILIPELSYDLDQIVEKLHRGQARGKLHSIILVAEGAGDILEIGRQIKEKSGMDTRATILGHIQRGGSPTATDRINASRLAALAVELLIEGETCKMTGFEAGRLTSRDLEYMLTAKKTLDQSILELSNILSI
ncbi:MAG: 6-phosphofructokinase [Firmicutes bacterium]|nr:6-phosphofructokinase [Bacillota bacterium]